MLVLIFGIRADSMELLRRWYTREDLLLVEDLHALSTRPATQEQLASLVKTWSDAGARVVMTGGGPISHLAALVDGLPASPTSRVISLRRPSRRDMRAIVLAMAKRSDGRLQGASVDDLTVWCAGDVRRAVGAIRQLKVGMKFEAAQGT